MPESKITSLHRARKAADRKKIRDSMEKLVAKLRDYYGDGDEDLDKEIECVRHGDPGAVGDLSVIIWAGGQLAMYRAIEG